MQRDWLRLVPGAVLYAIVCGSGEAAFFVVGFFAVTSFFAFIYVLLNGGPRTFGALLLSLIPVVGALIALERLGQKAGKQLLAGIFFYVYPMMLINATGFGLVVGALVGGGLFFSFFAFVPGVRHRPGATFVFMWALPTIFFFIIAAIVMPFIGRAADVDVADSDFDGYDAYDHGNDHQYIDYSAHDSSFDSTGGVEAGTHFDGGSFVDSHAAGLHDQFDLASYPEQSVPLIEQPVTAPTWFESRFDPTTGHFTMEGTHGTFDLQSHGPGELIGYNHDGAMIHITHNPETHSITMTGPDGIKFLHQDQGTGNWFHVGNEGLTTMSHDPNTGWSHIRGPGSEMTIKFNPFTDTATGTGTETI